LTPPLTQKQEPAAPSPLSPDRLMLLCGTLEICDRETCPLTESVVKSPVSTKIDLPLYGTV
jgi:hypothetical protein